MTDQDTSSAPIEEPAAEINVPIPPTVEVNTPVPSTVEVNTPVPAMAEFRRQAIEECNALNQRYIERASMTLLKQDKIGRASNKPEALKRFAKLAAEASEEDLKAALAAARALKAASPPKLELTPAPPKPKVKPPKPPKPEKAAKPPKPPKPPKAAKAPRKKKGAKKMGPKEGGSFDSRVFTLTYDPSVKAHAERLMNRGNMAPKPFSVQSRKIIVQWIELVKKGGSRTMTGVEMRKFVNSIGIESSNDPMVTFQDYFPYFKSNGFMTKE